MLTAETWEVFDALQIKKAAKEKGLDFDFLGHFVMDGGCNGFVAHWSKDFVWVEEYPDPDVEIPAEYIDQLVTEWINRPNKSKYSPDRDEGLNLDIAMLWLMQKGILPDRESLYVHCWW